MRHFSIGITECSVDWFLDGRTPTQVTAGNQSEKRELVSVQSRVRIKPRDHPVTAVEQDTMGAEKGKNKHTRGTHTHTQNRGRGRKNQSLDPMAWHYYHGDHQPGDATELFSPYTGRHLFQLSSIFLSLSLSFF